MQTAIEACIDIGNHLIATQGYRAPKDYRDVFLVLEENQVITHPVGDQLRQMAGLRNRLVHLYWEIDDDMFFEYLQANLGDFDLFVHQIAVFLKPIN